MAIRSFLFFVAFIRAYYIPRSVWRPNPRPDLPRHPPVARRSNGLLPDIERAGMVCWHKAMLAVVVTDAAIEGELPFERRKFGTLGSDLKALAEPCAWKATDMFP